MPEVVFETCIEGAQRGDLGLTWVQAIADNAHVILATDWLAGLHTTAALATGLRLLRFPKNTGVSPEVWANGLSLMQDDVSGDDRVRLQVFLLGAALENTGSASWKLVRFALPVNRRAKRPPFSG